MIVGNRSRGASSATLNGPKSKPLGEVMVNEEIWYPYDNHNEDLHSRVAEIIVLEEPDDIVGHTEQDHFERVADADKVMEFLASLHPVHLENARKIAKAGDMGLLRQYVFIAIDDRLAPEILMSKLTGSWPPKDYP